MSEFVMLMEVLVGKQFGGVWLDGAVKFGRTFLGKTGPIVDLVPF